MWAPETQVGFHWMELHFEPINSGEILSRIAWFPYSFVTYMDVGEERELGAASFTYWT